MASSKKNEQKRIVFIGRRNVGKSSLVNAFLGKEVCNIDECQAVDREVIEIPMELSPYGAVVIVDTIPLAGFNELVQNQVNQIVSVLASANIVVVVLDAREKLSQEDRNIFYHLKKLSIPFLAAVNKIEYGINSELINGLRANNTLHFEISCKEDVGIDALKARITRLLQTESKSSSKK